MSHPQEGLFLELLAADARRDRVRFEECQRFLAERGWLVERREPPRRVLEPQAEAPPVMGEPSPAGHLVNMLNRKDRRGGGGAGVC